MTQKSRSCHRACVDWESTWHIYLRVFTIKLVPGRSCSLSPSRTWVRRVEISDTRIGGNMRQNRQDPQSILGLSPWQGVHVTLHLRYRNKKIYPLDSKFTPWLYFPRKCVWLLSTMGDGGSHYSTLVHGKDPPISCLITVNQTGLKPNSRLSIGYRG